MKVLVIGAGGIIGQHMAISVPEGLEVIFTRRRGDGLLYQSLDVTSPHLSAWLDELQPDVIVNMAGENNPDAVERAPENHVAANVFAVSVLGVWCLENKRFLVHVSSQAAVDPVNSYGKQKATSESIAGSFCIVRPSFVLGIRPFPAIGRENPAERMLSCAEKYSVNDRKFTACFAWDVARVIWEAVQQMPAGVVWQVGGVDGVSRYDVARALGCNSEPISHDSLEGCAPRPTETTYTEFHGTRTDALEGFARLAEEFRYRSDDALPAKAREIAAFMRSQRSMERLACGFGYLHGAVNSEFRAANPQTEEELLDWYRKTDAYIWELTAYHCDPGFNYSGMVRGIVERLKSSGVDSILCLGDGTGDLTIACDKAGLDATYHDLRFSRTAMFAELRMDWRGCHAKVLESETFAPPVVDRQYESIVSLDFLEHVPNVEAWAKFVYDALKPGGVFVAQNAFAIGSGPDGSIPMHLACNDHWEKDWDPMLFSLGFKQLGPQWYQKPGSLPWRDWPAVPVAEAELVTA